MYRKSKHTFHVPELLKIVVYGMWKNTAETDRAQVTGQAIVDNIIQRMRTAHWIPKAIHTLKMCI